MNVYRVQLWLMDISNTHKLGALQYVTSIS